MNRRGRRGERRRREGCSEEGVLRCDAGECRLSQQQVCEVAVLRCRESGMEAGGRALWWRVVRRRSKLAGSFPGVQRRRMGGFG